MLLSLLAFPHFFSESCIIIKISAWNNFYPHCDVMIYKNKLISTSVNPGYETYFEETILIKVFVAWKIYIYIDIDIDIDI